MSIFQGLHKFDIDKSVEGLNNYIVYQTKPNGAYGSDLTERLSVSAPTIIHKWIMKNVPAFNVENYISSPYNFIDKISFQLDKTYDGQMYHNVANSWKKLTEQLMEQKE